MSKLPYVDDSKSPCTCEPEKSKCKKDRKHGHCVCWWDSEPCCHCGKGGCEFHGKPPLKKSKKKGKK